MFSPMFTEWRPAFAAGLFAEERDHFGRRASRAAEILDELFHEARACVGPMNDKGRAACSLRRLIWHRFGFRFRRSDTSEDFSLTSTLIHRGGNCLGLTSVYCALSGPLGLDVCALLYEGHVAPCLVREGRRPFPIHLGGAGGTTFHRSVGQKPGRERSGRPLTNREFLAVHMANRAVFLLVPAGEEARAMAQLDRCLELFPEYVGGRINRAALLAQMGRTGEAVDEIERAMALGPGPRYRMVVARLLARLAESGLMKIGFNGATAL